MAPTGTPEPILERLNTEIRKALQDRVLRAALTSDGSEPVGSSAAEYGAFIQKELQRWTEVIKTQQIVAN
jgi:tripartite-type tricarboxylate transporter receptor subunit TctC